MAITINNKQDIRRLNRYQERLDKAQHSLLKGVVPNCKESIRRYDRLISFLDNPDNADYSAINTNLQDDVLALFPQLRPHLQAIIDLIEGD